MTRCGHQALGGISSLGALWPLRKRLADTFHSQFLLWRSRNRFLKSNAPTLAPTRAPAVRVPYQWIEVALCGLPWLRRASLRGEPWGTLDRGARRSALARDVKNFG